MNSVNLLCFASTESETGFSYVFWILSGIVGVCLLLFVIRWIKGVSDRNDSRFVQDTINDIIEWLDAQGLMSRNESQNELQHVFEGRLSDSFRKHLLRLECTIRQISPSVCDQTMIVIFKNGEDIKEATFTRSINWDSLPAGIRKEFIMNNPKEITYNLLKKKEI